MASAWIQYLAIFAVSIAAASSCLIALDIVLARRQRMWIMNVVWPVTALYFGPFALWYYGRYVRGAAGPQPAWRNLVAAATHCGAGCVLGDIVGEWVVFRTDLRVAGSVLFANYVADFAFAYIGGIAFQYFAIPPARRSSVRQGIKRAIQADSVSLISFEIGMFAFMAILRKVFPPMTPTEPAYWFMMQIAMIAGFVTSLPANAWLLKKGIKEVM